MKKVAIIVKNHTEASLCLAKYIAREGVQVDFYYLTYLKRKQAQGFDFSYAPHKLGITELTKNDIPEICQDTIGTPVRYFLMRVWKLSYRTALFDIPLLWFMCRRIKSKKYDAINIMGQTEFVEIIHKYFKGENLIHTIHEVGSHQDDVPSTPLIDQIIRDRSKVILPSQSTLERFKAIHGSANCKSANIPVGKHETLLLYEEKKCLNIGLDLRKPTFLFFGYIKPYKGLDILLEACKGLLDIKDKFNIIIAGHGVDDSLAGFANFDNCYINNGFLSDSDMMNYIRNSTIIVLPYKSASQSGIVLTSFLYGKPVIATKVGALTETIVDEKNGLLIEPNNTEQFSQAMRRCIMSANLVEKLSKGAYAFGHGDIYDWANIARETLLFYEK